MRNGFIVAAVLAVAVILIAGGVALFGPDAASPSSPTLAGAGASGAPSATDSPIAQAATTGLPTQAARVTSPGSAGNTIQPPTTAPLSQAIEPVPQSNAPVKADFKRYQASLPKDAIRPIYEPKFIAGEDASLRREELVIGVALNGESRAYPVGPLNFREMVNDVVGGVPILVTW